MTDVQDVVLIHGLFNRHRWSEAFLEAMADIWGSEHVYIIYTNAPNDVNEKVFNGNVIYTIGHNNITAGTKSLDEQVREVERKIHIFQKSYGLGETFNIIGHSMGGIVARQYIYHQPGTVADLVTLGTPHHGSPLADYFGWFGYIIRSGKAFADNTPKRMRTFNERYPVAEAPLYNGGKIYTVRGYAEGKIRKNWGLTGEVYLGWLILRLTKRTASDGLVPHDSAVIKGAEHLADFPNYDHHGLAVRSSVAKEASLKVFNYRLRTTNGIISQKG
ncbi:esterase/lipase family protein [Natribacillus halophilus]|uniref:PGAP1-like protein n=1 Tax=Natribacillus halophilus TaxID=549003 RepID=A0A1G8KHH9_9BACI|nr:alpha/beta fold hydrolase [Natribacillus halophilus]SDI42866.1 PGAP1-like protein [Natribacillus halophilus]